MKQKPKICRWKGTAEEELEAMLKVNSHHTSSLSKCLTCSGGPEMEGKCEDYLSIDAFERNKYGFPKVPLCYPFGPRTYDARDDIPGIE